jgi:hypothetical protein
VTQPEPTDLPAVPAQEVTELEASAVLAVTGGLTAVLTPLLAGLLAMYEVAAAVGAATGLAAAALKQRATRGLLDLDWPSMDGTVATYDMRGQLLGQNRGLMEMTDRRSFSVGQIPLVDPGVIHLDGAVRSRLSEAAKLAQVLPLDSKRNVMAVIGKASSARSLAEGVTAAVVYGGVSKGKLAVAKAAGRNLLWVPERDACLHCLAHAGWVWKPGKRLPRGLTYADKPLKVRVSYPPLHPWCRCEAVLTDLPVGAPASERSRTDPAARLAAEARRSVVLGWTGHASQAATLRAMDRLLQQGADLPTSVEQRARRAVRAGRPTRRPR